MPVAAADRRRRDFFLAPADDELVGAKTIECCCGQRLRMPPGDAMDPHRSCPGRCRVRPEVITMRVIASRS